MCKLLPIVRTSRPLFASPIFLSHYFSLILLMCILVMRGFKLSHLKCLGIKQSLAFTGVVSSWQ